MSLPMAVNVLGWLDLEHCLPAYCPRRLRHIEAALSTFATNCAGIKISVLRILRLSNIHLIWQLCGVLVLSAHKEDAALRLIIRFRGHACAHEQSDCDGSDSGQAQMINNRTMIQRACCGSTSEIDIRILFKHK